MEKYDVNKKKKRKERIKKNVSNGNGNGDKNIDRKKYDDYNGDREENSK